MGNGIKLELDSVYICEGWYVSSDAVASKCVYLFKYLMNALARGPKMDAYACICCLLTPPDVGQLGFNSDGHGGAGLNGCACCPAGPLTSYTTVRITAILPIRV